MHGKNGGVFASRSRCAAVDVAEGVDAVVVDDDTTSGSHDRADNRR